MAIPSWRQALSASPYRPLIGADNIGASALPAMFIVLPRFYGGPLSQLFNLTQHAGMNEDVYDHRLNTRTVILNPVFSFLYANMNYHIEHHMFPMVPFYRLPELHELINADCPPAYSGLRAAYREIVPALLRQRKDPS
jgi:fatty acid desaturase